MHLLLLLAALSTGVAQWCGIEGWNEHPRKCLERAGLTERHRYFENLVNDIARSQTLATLSVRPGGLYDEEHRVEVWHIAVGTYEIRIRPDELRDASDDMLMYYGAHEVCHIINGDAGYGTWDSWTDEEKKVRHRWVYACAFALIGEEVFAAYLRESECRYTAEEQKELLRRIRYDAQWWLQWRRSKKMIVP